MSKEKRDKARKKPLQRKATKRTSAKRPAQRASTKDTALKTKRTTTKRALAQDAVTNQAATKNATPKASKQTPKKAAPIRHKKREKRATRKDKLKRAKHIGIAAAVVIVIGAAALFVLSLTNVFSVQSVQFAATEHITQEDIARLVELPQNANLLNVSNKKIEDALKRNPWVASVTFTREFPHTLHLEVHEKTIAALVVLPLSSTVWALSDNNTWIEPVPINDAAQSLAQAATGLALNIGCVVIDGVANTVSPKTNAACDDENINAAMRYQTSFTSELASQVIQYKVETQESLSCELKSGVEVLLGNPEDISLKERIILELLNKYLNQLTSINVRLPDRPSYKKIAGDSYNAGTGVTGS